MKKDMYESAVLINPVLDDSQIDSLINRIRDFITNNNGQVIDIDNWGRKRLAYPVRKHKVGYYVIFRLIVPTNIISKLERFYNLDDNILRFLTIKLNKYAIEHLEKQKNLTSPSKKEVIIENEIFSEIETKNDDIDNSKI